MEAKKKIALIGIGNCGNQVTYQGEKMYPELFDCLYINTSDADLAMVQTDYPKYKIGKDNEEEEIEGSGKNRSKMKDYMRSYIKEIVEDDLFQDTIKEKKYVFIIVSTAGGSGSGAGPMMYTLLSNVFPDINFFLVPVFPNMSTASLLELCNTLEFTDELYKKMPASTTYMAYDNDTRSDLPATASLESVNCSIIEDIRIFSGIDNMPTPYESIDDADMESLTSTPGRVLIASLDGTNLTEKLLEDNRLDDFIIKAIKKSAHVETDRNRRVVRWGIITYLNAAVNRLYNPKLEKLEEFLGVPVQRFNHNAVNDMSEKMNFMHFIASGLPPINDKAEKIRNRIRELRESQPAGNEGYISTQDDDILSTLSEYRKGKSKNNTDTVTVTDILSQF